MALSMDEQRILAEIERKLAADDPGLASCLSTFRRPGPGTVFRSPRARIIGSLFTVLLVALVSLMVYAMIPFRAHTTRINDPPSGAGVNTAISAAVSQQTAVSPSTGARSSAVASAPNRSAVRSSAPAASQTQAARPKQTGASASPGGYPVTGSG
jgi:Protein of unknown function (DUF3040)